jgi:hypothetical protein
MAMKKLLIALLLLPFFAFTQTISPVIIKDFKPAFGKWTGSLTYLDYSSGKPYTMPANVTISKGSDNKQQLLLAFEYPDEPKANGNDTLVISDDGLNIDGATVVAKTKNNDGSLVIITDKEGVDGNENRSATLRHIYTVGKKIFSNRKEVRFKGEEKFILRNEFKMRR